MKKAIKRSEGWQNQQKRQRRVVERNEEEAEQRGVIKSLKNRPRTFQNKAERLPVNLLVKAHLECQFEVAREPSLFSNVKLSNKSNELIIRGGRETIKEE